MNKLEESNFPVEEEAIEDNNPNECCCFECREPMTVEEISNWEKNTPRCCDGHMCGCMGMPIDPPYCDKCVEEGRRMLKEEEEI